MQSLPDKPGSGVKFIDLNGTGEWSLVRVRERYLQHCAQLNVPPNELHPEEHTSEEGHWVYPIMHLVIDGIVANDRACVAIGVELIESNQKIPFGFKFRYQTARALRRAVLDSHHISRLRKRIVSMLITGELPMEMKEYIRLLRTIGAAEYWPTLDGSINRDSKSAMRHYRTLRTNDRTAPPE